jgi:orotate phosphoribosyltransferase
MDDVQKENWKQVALSIKDALDSRPIYSEKAFTPHDFSNHCNNIYKIISKDIFYKDVLTKEKFQDNDVPEISSEAFYLLNIAVLFHDYSMTNLKCNRLQHSAESAEMFRDFCKSNDFVGRSILTPKQIKIVSSIIRAHCDIKEIIDGKETVKEKTLESSDLKVFVEGDSENEIHVRFLAGILRLADELDLTEDRAGSEVEQINLLDENDPEQKKSKQFWEKLLYFDEIDFDDTDNNLVLKIKESKFDFDTIKGEEIVVGVLKKVNNELANITKICFSGDYRKHIRCFGVKAIIRDRYIKINSLPNSNEDEDIARRNTNISLIPTLPLNPDKHQIELIGGEFVSNYIDNVVYRMNLIQDGHFNINETFCTRDWINSKKLIDNKTYRRFISETIKTIINKNEDISKILLVGIDVYGAIIASLVAFDLSLPFSYIITDKTKSHNSIQDKKFDVDVSKKIILITDVIVTFETLRKAVESNGIIDRVTAIYSIFCRKTNQINDFEKEISDSVNSNYDYFKEVRTYTLNNKIDVWLFPKKNCPVRFLSERCSKSFTCIDCHILKN